MHDDHSFTSVTIGRHCAFEPGLIVRRKSFSDKVNLGFNVSNSACNCGCLVDGSNVSIIIILYVNIHAPIINLSFIFASCMHNNYLPISLYEKYTKFSYFPLLNMPDS